MFYLSPISQAKLIFVCARHILMCQQQILSFKTKNQKIACLFFRFIFSISLSLSRRRKKRTQKWKIEFFVCGNDAVNALGTVRHNVEPSCCRVSSGEKEHDLSIFFLSTKKINTEMGININFPSSLKGRRENILLRNKNKKIKIKKRGRNNTGRDIGERCVLLII